MIPDSNIIINDIINLLAKRDPDVDPDELVSKLDQPLDQIYKINSQIGMGIASELRELYSLPEIPPTKLKNRKFYISINGLAELIIEMSKYS
jgi:hypothetical protein